MLVLVISTILAPGRRAVAAALRVMGLVQAGHFTNYHQVLNRIRWWPWLLSRMLLNLIVKQCLGVDEPIWLLIDDTLERRRGDGSKHKG